MGPSEAASNRRLPPLGPDNQAPAWHVPLPVLSGPNLEAALRGGFQLFLAQRTGKHGSSSCRRPVHRKGHLDQARFDLRGYTTSGSVSTLTSAGAPASNARASAGLRSSGVRTSSPWQPSASTIWS